MRKLFLLDAFALIFRAYYALMKSPRITTKGKNTNAQLGFTNTLFEILNKEKPTHIAVAFDTAALTERHITYDAYKAQRQETPEDIIAAIPDIKKILKALRIEILEMDGFEADDIIGTMAIKAAKEGFQVYMVSSDKDYGQIVDENIFLYKPAFQKQERKILGIKEICLEWDIETTKQLIDILGLMGDAVDNIPGIPGIGEKTAVKLIKEYGSFENIITQANQIKGSIGEKIRNNIHLGEMSKKLATINQNVPIDISMDMFKIKEIDSLSLKNIFEELEFKTLLKRILGNNNHQVSSDGLFDIEDKKTISLPNIENHASVYNDITNTPHTYLLIDNEEQIITLVDYLEQFSAICIDTETTGLDIMEAEIVGMSFCAEKGKAFYLSFPTSKEKIKNYLDLLKKIFNRGNVLWIGQNLKYDLGILRNYQVTLHGTFFDTMLVQYLLDPESKRGMDFLSEKYLHYKPISIETLIGEKGKKTKKHARC